MFSPAAVGCVCQLMMMMMISSLPTFELYDPRREVFAIRSFLPSGIDMLWQAAEQAKEEIRIRKPFISHSRLSSSQKKTL